MKGITYTPGPGHVTLIPDKDCSVRIRTKDGEMLLEINSNKTISILGETFELEKLKDWLVNNFKSGNCTCSTTQLIYKGCSCGGK